MRTLFRKQIHRPRPRATDRSRLLAGLIVVTQVLGSGNVGSAPRKAPPGAQAVPAHQLATQRITAVKSWAYQLQGADPREIARSPYDLVVVDYTVNGDPEKPLKPADVERMKKKPDGSRRIVLAYISIGEAEDYRFYWDESWVETAAPGGGGSPAPGEAVQPPASGSAAADLPGSRPDRWISGKAPPWLGDESETWGGNFAVKYWDPDWQSLIFGTPQSFVERVLALGFDGVYLDRVDAYYEHIDERPSAADDMVDFVIRLATAARTARPGALVVPQNGEELLTRQSYVAAIDAIAKEDLLYGSPSEGVANSSAQIANSLGWLSHARVAGRPVMVIEYLDDETARRAAQQNLAQRGFIAYFGPRSLDRLESPLAAAPANPRPATATGR